MASVDEVRMVFENPDFYLRRSRHNIRIREETVNDFTQGHDYKRVLDIGCGDGSLSAPLLRARNRLTLLDVSSAMLLKARDQIPRELIRHVEFVNDDFLTAPLIAGYDLIICVGVLAHVSSPISVIRRIGSLLSPNGSVIVQVTDCRHVLSRVMRAYGKLRQWVFPAQTCSLAKDVISLTYIDTLNLCPAWCAF